MSLTPNDEADRMIRWLMMNRFNTPDNQPSPEVQAELEQLPWNKIRLEGGCPCC